MFYQLVSFNDDDCSFTHKEFALRRKAVQAMESAFVKTYGFGCQSVDEALNEETYESGFSADNGTAFIRNLMGINYDWQILEVEAPEPEIDATDDEIESVIKEHLGNERSLEEIDGRFVHELYADYDDTIGTKEIGSILDSDDPEVAFYSFLESSYDAIRTDLLAIYEGGAENAVVEKWGPLSSAQQQFVWETVDYLVDFTYPDQHYLSQDIRVNIVVDTGDGNYDYTLNCAAPAWGGATKIDPRASLCFLAKTQGYNIEQLQDALDQGETGAVETESFLDSIRDEVANEGSNIAMLVILARMTLQDAIALNNMVHNTEKTGDRYEPWKSPDCGSIKVSKNAELGLFDDWNGAGK